MAIMLCVYEGTLYAQEEFPLLESKPIRGHMVLVQLPPTCQCLKKIYPPRQKQGPIFSVDIPFSPFWDTVREDRIKNHTIQFGGTATPWARTVMFGGWPVPRVIFMAPDFRTMLEGGIMKTLDVSPSRTMTQAYVVLEGVVWHVVVGADSLLGQEQIPRFIKGVNFETDFRRRSYGGQGWLGIKFGDFNRNFILGRYGVGYVWTEGSMRFDISDVSGLDWLPAYLEEFRTDSFSAESKVTTRRISHSVRFDWVEYERVIPSPDPLRFGENHLLDMRLRTETEIIPFARARFLRGVVILTKDFRDRNLLMFINDYSLVRVLLRLSFN